MTIYTLDKWNNKNNFLDFDNTDDLLRYIIDNKIVVFNDSNKKDKYYNNSYYDYSKSDYQKLGFRIYHCKASIYNKIIKSIKAV